MKGQHILIGALALGLFLALAVGLSQAQGPEPPQGDANRAPEVEAVAEVGNRIPIQGRLTDASSKPLSGTYTIDFYLYDALTEGNLVCYDNVGNDVPASNGLFTWEIFGNCGSDDMNGQQLYLEIRVEGETLSPRQAIYPVPYAFSLRPGAVISDTYTYVQLNGGVPHLLSIAGVIGRATGDLGNLGVYGTIDGVGAGIYGESTSDSGYAGFFSGKVGQSREDGGLVKAAVAAFCDDADSALWRSFNNVNSTSIAIFDGLSDGRCVIDFGFRIDDRYFVATALSSAGGLPRGASCYWGGDDEKLECGIWDTAGNGVSGAIMVLIY